MHLLTRSLSDTYLRNKKVPARFDQFLLNDSTCHDVKFSREKFISWLDQLVLICECQKSVVPSGNSSTFKHCLKSNAFPITKISSASLHLPLPLACPWPASALTSFLRSKQNLSFISLHVRAVRLASLYNVPLYLEFYAKVLLLV